VALTNLDRDLLKRCLAHQAGAWNDFVDRFLGLIYHVIRHTAHLRSAPLTPEDVEDMAAEILLQIVAHDYGILRQFRGHSSLATYLTVIARRICVHELARRSAARDVQAPGGVDLDTVPAKPAPREEVEEREEVEKLLSRLSGREREVVWLRFIEGRSYEEISTTLDIPVNTVGSILTRAKARMAKTREKAARTDQLPMRRDSAPEAEK
jgi:RNA polymerase sigma-70 factor (ECF subfamily)